MTKLSAYILLDRSGSMAGAKWETAIESINGQVSTLKKEGIEAEVTVAAFDSTYEHTETASIPRSPLLGGHGGQAINWNSNLYNRDSQLKPQFDIIRSKKSLKSFKKLTPTEVTPRGGTPLYDATGKMLNLADANNNEKTVIIIMTDGAENESRIYNIESIKDRIATCTHRGWEVVFLGAEFNAHKHATDYGLSGSKVMNSSLGSMNNDMTSYATASASYMKSGEAFDTTKMNQEK